MSSVDPFGRTDTLDDDLLEALVQRFEARGKHPLFSMMLQQYLDAMQIDSAGAVLDMGCGTGLAARAIAHRAAFSGRIVGVDLSPYARNLTPVCVVGDRPGEFLVVSH